MEYNMNMYAKLLHTSISRVSYEGNVVKIYGNLTDFHITYVVKKIQGRKGRYGKLSVSGEFVPGCDNCGSGRFGKGIVSDTDRYHLKSISR